MESLENKIREFVSVSSGYGDGSGFGSGDGFGSGYGDGSGFGSGDGFGSGYGDGSGFGSGNGDGFGSGNGYGYGFGSGDGFGSGYGDGSGKIKTYNRQRVYYIDDVPTLIDRVRNNVARGYIINADKTISDSYIVRIGNSFAHGKTLHAAHSDAMFKHMRNIPEEERIAEFIKAYPDLNTEYPCKDLFKWHNILTGSCEMGRMQFCKDYQIDLDSQYSIRFFLDITKDAYGGEVIKRAREMYD